MSVESDEPQFELVVGDTTQPLQSEEDEEPRSRADEEGED